MLSIKVFYKGKEVGIVAESKKNSNYFTFRYNDDFIKHGVELCPILMPLKSVNYVFTNLSLSSFKGLPPLLADSLPDKYGSDLLFAYQRIYGKSSLSPLEALSYIGKRGMGALEFVPSVDKIGMSEDEIIEIDSLVEVADQVLNQRESVNYSLKNIKLRQLISVGSSIGGARAKAIVAIDKNGNIKSGQISGLKDYEYCIIKLDGLGADLSEDNNVTYYTRIEYAYYLMAIDCGINMSNCSLLHINNKYHFKTSRFDRDSDGNKIHMLSLAGMMGFDYLKAGEHSYEEVGAVLKNLDCGMDDFEQLFRRMTFNVVFRNNDDHVKNISFIMDDKGKYKLSPAYDLSYSYNPHGDWTKHHQMKINNKIDDITRGDLLSAAEQMYLNKNKANKIIDEILNIKNDFDYYASKAEIPESVSSLIKKEFIDLD